MDEETMKQVNGIVKDAIIEMPESNGTIEITKSPKSDEQPKSDKNTQNEPNNNRVSNLQKRREERSRKLNGLQNGGHEELTRQLRRLQHLRNKGLGRLSEDDTESNKESENGESENKSEAGSEKQTDDTSGQSEEQTGSQSQDNLSESDEEPDLPKPKVIIFDLDYTLWPFWVDRKVNVEPPFCRVPDGRVYDAAQHEMKAFPDITNILQRLYNDGIVLGIASEAFNKDEVRNLVTYFGWDKYIPYIEIFPGSKITHFVKIKRQCNIDFTEWLYFDDEKEHLREVVNTCLGITCVLADRGVSEDLLEQGLETFATLHINGNLYEGPFCNENTKTRSRRGSRCSLDNTPLLPNAKMLSRRRGSCFY
ncbi:hypothetical protein ScPMuIL_002022 [Solemya velum]